MIPFKLTIGILIPILLGWSLIKYLFRKNPLSIFFELALAYGCGTGILSLYMLILALVGIKYSFAAVSIPFLSLSAALFALSRKHAAPAAHHSWGNTVSSLKNYFKNFSLIQGAYLIFYGAIVFYILLNIYYVFWVNLNHPVEIFDAFSRIVIKAKVYFYNKTIFAAQRFYHPVAPIHIPLVQTWIAISLNQWSDQLIKVIFPVTFLSFLTIHFYFIKDRLNKAWALLGTGLLISSSYFVEASVVSLEDFTLMTYNCTAVMLLFFWFKSNNKSYLILAAIYSGLTAFTKLEGIGYLCIHTVLLVIMSAVKTEIGIKEKISGLIKFLALNCSIYGLYRLYILPIKTPPEDNRFHFEIYSEIFNRAHIIISRFTENLFMYWQWSMVWILLALSLLCAVKVLKHLEVKLMLTALSMYFLLHFMICLLTPSYMRIITTHTYDVLPRITLHFYPLAVLTIVLLNYHIHSKAPEPE